MSTHIIKGIYRRKDEPTEETPVFIQLNQEDFLPTMSCLREELLVKAYHIDLVSKNGTLLQHIATLEPEGFNPSGKLTLTTYQIRPEYADIILVTESGCIKTNMRLNM